MATTIKVNGVDRTALPNMRVEYVHREPPGVPTAFWRSVGPSHNVFVVESFMDELAAAAKQDAVAYRLALLDAGRYGRVEAAGVSEVSSQCVRNAAETSEEARRPTRR
jgi:CO/xanthine dehydrogenase Mo-binding subunit